MHDAANDSPRCLQLGSGPLQLLNQLQQDEERLAILKEAIDLLPIAAGITISDREGKIAYVNLAEAEMHGYACSELVGRPACVLAPEGKPSGRRIDQRTAGLWKRECLNVRKDGKIFPVQLTSLPIRNAGGDYLGMLTACEDMTQKKICEQQLETLAYYDSVTKLPNRALLMDRLHQAIALAQRERRELALLFLDLDNFKDLNSSKGHEAGDKFLQEVAARLAGCLCESNTLARLGGDEFVIVINPVPGEEGVAATAARLQALFAEPFVIDGEELYGSTSIGIALFPEDGRDVESLLRSADAALYQAKRGGKAGYQFFSQEMNQVNMRRVALENGMRQGLARGEFYLYFQPQWDLKTLRLTGAEALLRWHSAEFGLVGPDEFIPIAESCGLIFELGDLVLREACLHAVQWDAFFPGLKVAVNISGRQFRQPDFLESVACVIEETGVRPSSLELEFTESVIMERAEKNIHALQALKQMGVRLSIDDFGTGYSSLNYLKHFPIDAIKIDRSFIAELVTDSDDAAIAAAIISMAHNLKLKVIAEGVESDAQLDFLVERCCDEAQGFYFSPPMGGEDFTGYMKRFSAPDDASKPLSVAG